LPASRSAGRFNFQLWGGDDDHDHGGEHGHDDHGHDKHAGHDDHPAAVDWAGLDMQDATTDGSAVPLVPVIGKITVFDFWASWCKPCKVLERGLAELARRHPDRIAVRKLNVIDDDSAASKKYIGKYTLPHIKVYGVDGALLWERSAPPLELVGAVAALLARKPAPVAVAGARRIAIVANDKGYVPNRIEVLRGERFVLVFTRTTENTCTTDVHFALPDGTRIDKDLPLGTSVEVPLVFDKPGEVTFACGMDMDRGTIVVK
jgi:thiol-disulfide isomerase/thioredoxin